MDEDDYIELQTLLLKLRVVYLKEISNPNTKTKVMEKDMQIIRKIDYLRKNVEPYIEYEKLIDKM